MDMYTDNAKRRVEIFEDTIDMCWDNKYLSDSIDDTIEKTMNSTENKSLKINK